MRRLLALTACAIAVAGCGDKSPETVVADTEGVWLDVGELDYHIQGSRQLNPYQVPDDRYLTGLPKGYGAPGADQTWFAVFVRIENKTDAPAATAEEFEIEDTLGTRYQPVPLDPSANPYAYAPTDLGVKEAVPHPDSTQDIDSAAGAMLLFKLPLDGYQNRPLEFTIRAPDGESGPESASVDLDV